MIQAVADTHAIVWYLFEDPRLSRPALEMMEKIAASDDHVAISSITLVEIVYLIEKARLGGDALDRVDQALDDPNMMLLVAPLEREVVAAMKDIERSVVPELPDRVIAATAHALRVPLITKDAALWRSTVDTIW